jgi:hypothetical protein
MRKIVMCSILALYLTGCVQKTWTHGPAAMGKDFGSTNGQCKLVGMGAERGYAAFGNSYHVAGAALGNAIGNIIRTQAAYDACMEANGFIVVAPPPPT